MFCMHALTRRQWIAALLLVLAVGAAFARSFGIAGLLAGIGVGVLATGRR
jgi:hypothetical protein